MTMEEILVLVISLARSVMWLAGSFFILYFGRQVQRLVRPSYFISLGMFLAGVNSVVVTANLTRVWNLPHWLHDTSLVMATPTVTLIVGGIIYPFANAVSLQRNAENLGSDAREANGFKQDDT